MTSLPDDWNDIWTTPETQQQDTGGTAVNIETINDIEPLDDQFGIDPKKTVPDAFYDAFFGQPQPSDTEIAAAGGDPKNVPAMQTYALLDAAKVTHLPELLAASDLEHRCLFKGDAYDDLKDAAPWLVRLEKGNDFTRNLFTKGDAPWHLWGAEAGIYIRSRASLEELWKHFRKFTRIQDENGKWYYLRLYEPQTLIYYFDGIRFSPKRVQQVLRTQSGVSLDRLIAVFPNQNRAVSIQEHSGQHQANDYVFELDPRYTQDFLCRSIDLMLEYAPTLKAYRKLDLLRTARAYIPDFYTFDLTSKPAVAQALATIMLSGRPLTGLNAQDQNILRDQAMSQYKRTGILLQKFNSQYNGSL